MAGFRPSHVLLAALFVVASGCVVPVKFDPTGNDVAITGTWQLQMGSSGTPEAATAASCSAAGVSDVQLVFYNEFGNSPFVSDEFKFPCAQGSFDSTDPSFNAPDGKVLSSGVYTTQWQGLDAQGTVVGYSGKAIMDVTFLSQATIPTVSGSDVIVVQ